MHQINTSLQRPVSMNLSQSQQARLSYIDFKLYFLGELRRTDIMDHFGIGPAAATRDITAYKKIAPNNLQLNNIDKTYYPTDNFVPFFKHSPQNTLMALSQGLSEGTKFDKLQSKIPSDFPKILSIPNIAILAPMTRAINLGKAVHITYTSIRSGRATREVVPLAIVDIGIRWHVRAFDRKSKEFRDFVITRIENPKILNNSFITDEERIERDIQWNRIIELELVPHPKHPRPEIVKMDYGIQEEVLRVNIRAASAGYMLRILSVDCSPDHSLEGLEYALWLRDPLSLYGASNASLAPGYKIPINHRSISAL